MSFANQITCPERYRISLILDKHSLKRLRGSSTNSAWKTSIEVIWTLFANCDNFEANILRNTTMRK